MKFWMRALIFGAAIASLSASAEVFHFGGLYTGPTYGATGYAGPAWPAYSGKTYVSTTTWGARNPAGTFVFGAFAPETKHVHSRFLLDVPVLTGRRLVVTAPRLFPAESPVAPAPYFKPEHGLFSTTAVAAE